MVWGRAREAVRLRCLTLVYKRERPSQEEGKEEKTVLGSFVPLTEHGGQLLSREGRSCGYRAGSQICSFHHSMC